MKYSGTLVALTRSHGLETAERWALDQPNRRMPRLGLAIHPNTDDPTLHRGTPAQAWQRTHTEFGFGVEDLRAFMDHDVRVARLDEATRRQWAPAFDAGFDKALAMGRARAPSNHGPRSELGRADT